VRDSKGECNSTCRIFFPVLRSTNFLRNAHTRTMLVKRPKERKQRTNSDIVLNRKANISHIIASVPMKLGIHMIAVHGRMVSMIMDLMRYPVTRAHECMHDPSNWMKMSLSVESIHGYKVSRQMLRI